MRQFDDEQIVPGTRYRVLRLIGSGGMGSVFDVEHQELGRRFVLKALHRGFGARDDLSARLRTEWRALGKLEHPNIVDVTDAGTTSDGVAFYVMTRLEGETLSARLRREKRLLLGETLRISMGIAEGLGAAHAIGIVHRDVKPANIFLTRDGGIKLLDFGIAKMADQQSAPITARGVAIGTPRYMSPEQVRGHRVDGRADLYALGLIVFEMLSGEQPFEATPEPSDLLVAHLTQPPRRLTSVIAVPAQLDELVARLLAKDPRERPPNAAAVTGALRDIALAQPYSAATATAVAAYDAFTVPDPRVGPTEPASPPDTAQSTGAGTTAIETTVAGPTAPRRTLLAFPDDVLTSPITADVPLEPETVPGVDSDPEFDTDVSPVEPSTEPNAGPDTFPLDASGEPAEPEVITHTAVRLEPVSGDAIHNTTPPPVAHAAPAPAQARRARAPLFGIAFFGITLLGVATWAMLRPSPSGPAGSAQLVSPMEQRPAAPAPAAAAPPPAAASPGLQAETAPTPVASVWAGVATRAPEKSQETAPPASAPPRAASRSTRAKPRSESNDKPLKLPSSGL